MTRVLLLDNRDSFVWNLAQALDALGARTDVVRSDRTTVDDLRRRQPDALVLSPGPGRPEQAGVSIEAVRTFHGELPILGVCLGHQAIGAAFGAVIDRMPPCHGKPWAIRHAGEGLFRGMTSPLEFCRYHSLGIVGGLPDEIVADAWTAEEEVMSIRHREHPTFGLQFHPESFRSPHGPALLARFLGYAS